MSSRNTSFQWLGMLLLSMAAPGFAAPPPSAAPTFEKDVRPILKAHCFQCHGESGKLKGDLDVRLTRLMLKGGENGPAVVPGKPAESSLFTKVRDGEMPKGEKEKKLTAREVLILEQWIAAGAKTVRPEPKDPEAAVITEEERSFWAFQPVRRPQVPAAPVDARVRNPVDAFVWQKLHEKGLSFSPEADRRTLIRRVTFDLHGLPPTPEEVEAFVKDQSPDAYEKLIDRLLASPRYGERWGRHWLDVAGYADSEGGSEADTPRKYAYKYRDYVIRAFNSDKPFDQFIQEQLAGDEMVKPPYTNLANDEQAAEKLIATGFLRMAPDGTSSTATDLKLGANQNIADSIKVVTTSLLGLTVACAQCHDHRYDPIPQTDYYRLRAVFDPAYDWEQWRRPAARVVSLYTPEERKKAAEIEAEAAKREKDIAERSRLALEAVFEREIVKVPEAEREQVRVARNLAPNKRTPEQEKLLRKYPKANVNRSLNLYDPETFKKLEAERAEVAKLRATKPPEDFISCVTEVPGRVPVTKLFNRGDHEQPKQPVTPGELSVLCSNRPTADIPAKDPKLPTSGRRLAYAKMLTDGKHPLVGRVLMNRVWLNHFGRGIVASAGDFGALGERPTHPELLDWLADEFVHGARASSPASAKRKDAGGDARAPWTLKRMHRLIMTSTAYRQSSQHRPELDAADPDNKLLGRMNVRRIEAEAVRDSVLFVSGSFNPKMYGPPIPTAENSFGEIVVGKQVRDINRLKSKAEPIGDEEFRRSVYVQVRRSEPLAVLETFDLPPMTPNCDVRRASTVAPQSLVFLNDQFVVDQAERLATRLRKEHPVHLTAQVKWAWLLLYGGEPSREELRDAVEFIAAQEQHFQSLVKPAAKAPVAKAPATKPATQPAGPDPKVQALASWCQALLGTNRFLYVD